MKLKIGKLANLILAQVNPKLGDLRGNMEVMIKALLENRADELTIFPANALTGCPLAALEDCDDFIAAYKETLAKFARAVRGTVILGGLDETLVVIQAGKIAGVFESSLSGAQVTLEINRRKFLVINDELSLMEINPRSLAGIIYLSAVTFDELDSPISFVEGFCLEYHLIFINANLCGAQDEQVFTGESQIVAANGKVIFAAAFGEVATVNIEAEIITHPAADEKIPDQRRRLSYNRELPDDVNEAAAIIREIRRNFIFPTLIIGLRDYVYKNGFKKVILGISGGVDSALVAALAVTALGKEKVIGVTMPSVYSSAATQADARRLAENLGIELLTLPIAAPLAAFDEMLKPLLEIAPVTDHENLMAQNLQARTRAIYLMALANRYGWLLLNTTNKSEYLVGYGTLYGDLAGGFAPLKDVYKSEVWALAQYINEISGRELIPSTTIERVPSAELRADQEDRQSIPDYPILDNILRLFWDAEKPLAAIIAAGHDAATTARVIDLVYRHEFKRRQMAIGTLLSPSDWSLPITNHFTSAR